MKLYINKLFRAYTTPFRGLSSTLWRGITLTLVESITSGIIFFLTLYFVNNLHFSMTQSASLISIYATGTIIGSVTIGILTDRINPKNLSLFCLLLQSIVFILLVKFINMYVIAVALFSLGFSTYGFTTSLNTWMLNRCLEDTELELKFINLSRVAVNLGFGIAGILLTFIEITYFKYIFESFALTLILCVIAIVIDTQFIPKNEPKKSSQATFTSINKSLYISLLFSILMIGFIISQLGSTYPVYISDIYPLGTKGVGFLFILDTFIVAICQAHLIHYLQNFNKIKLIGIGGFFMGFSLILLNLPPIFLFAIFSCIVWTIGEMIFIPTSQFVFYNCIRNNKPGQHLGIYQATTAFSRVIGPLAGGILYQQAGGHTLWNICGLIGLLCLFICFKFRNVVLKM